MPNSGTFHPEKWALCVLYGTREWVPVVTIHTKRTPSETFQERELPSHLCHYSTNADRGLLGCQVPGSAKGETAAFSCQGLHSQDTFHHRGDIWRCLEVPVVITAEILSTEMLPAYSWQRWWMVLNILQGIGEWYFSHPLSTPCQLWRL